MLELVEGPTLADRIARGPIPLDEALPIARQIAEALEAAHEQGIIHRDLKPANIKLRPDGAVKVLDFGLAKLAAPVEAQFGRATSTSRRRSRALAMTGIGVLLGTAAYMSPEQAKGRAADKRSDVWAFGCVLYEMLTGRRAFQGDDVSDTMAAVLRGEPDWNLLPSDLAPAVRSLLRRALEKDRRERIGDAAAALFVLRDLDHLSHASGPVVRRGRPRTAIAFVAVALAGAGARRGDPVDRDAACACAFRSVSFFSSAAAKLPIEQRRQHARCSAVGRWPPHRIHCSRRQGREPAMAAIVRRTRRPAAARD